MSINTITINGKKYQVFLNYNSRMRKFYYEVQLISFWNLFRKVKRCPLLIERPTSNGWIELQLPAFQSALTAHSWLTWAKEAEKSPDVKLTT